MPVYVGEIPLTLVALAVKYIEVVTEKLPIECRIDKKSNQSQEYLDFSIGCPDCGTYISL